MPQTGVRKFMGTSLTTYSPTSYDQMEAFKDKRLRRNADGDKYKICTYQMTVSRYYCLENAALIKEVDADGVFLIVVLPHAPEIAFVRREPENRAYRTGEATNYQRGHSSIAEGRKVIFAGELYFKEGKLTDWSPKTGHYQVGKFNISMFNHVKEQTQFLVNDGDKHRLLPMNFFRPAWTD